MKQILKLIFLLVIGQTALAQAPSNYVNINGRYRWIAGMFDSTFHIPKGTTPSLRTGGSTNGGALFYKTADSSLHLYTGSLWLRMLKVGDTTGMLTPYFNSVGVGLKNTGQTVYADTLLLSTRLWRNKGIDSVQANLTAGLATKLNISDTSSMLSPYARTVNVRQIVSDSLGGLVRLKALNAGGAALYANSGTKVAEWGLGGSANIDFHGFAGYDINRAGSYTVRSFTDKNYVDSAINASPSGTVTSVATNTGTGITGGTITTSGTIAADTLLLSTRAWRQKGVDSVASLINTRISGTTNYIPKFTSSSAIGNSVIYEGTRSLGIGTATPVDFGAGTFNVNINDSGIPLIQFTNSTTGLGTSVGMRIQSHANDFYYINSQTTGSQIWYTNSSERMRLDASGNLGLGTSSPAAKLHVAAAAVSGTIDRAVIIANSSASGSGSGSEIYLGWNSPSINAGAGVTIGASYAGGGTNMLFSTPSSIPSAPNVKMTLDGNGNLGLGVTPAAWSGGQALQILNGSLYGSGNLIGYAANSYLANSAANDRYIVTGAAIKYLGNINGDHRWYVAPSGTAGDIISFTQAMTLDASGNLLLGGTTGNDRLVINDSKSSTSQYTSTGFVTISNSDQTNNNWSTIAFTDGPTQAFSTAIQTKYTDHTNNYGELHISTRSSAGLTTKLMIAEGGNVGIGTTSPLYTFHTVSSSTSIGAFRNSGAANGQLLVGNTAGDLALRILASGDALIFSDASKYLAFGTAGGSERMRITSGGDVLVGTTTVQNSAAGRGNITIGGTSSSILNFGFNSTDNGYIYHNGDMFFVNTVAIGALSFQTNSSERMRITSGGLVGIGTSNPTSRFAVRGVNSNSQIEFDNFGSGVNYILSIDRVASAYRDIVLVTNSSNNTLYAATSGNVGIGTSTPGSKLEVNGAIKTAAPSGGTAASWKLGERVASSGVTFNDQQYIQLDIGGTLYYLATVDLPMPEAYPQATSGPSNNYKITPVQVKTTRDAEIENLKKEIEELKQLIKNK